MSKLVNAYEVVEEERHMKELMERKTTIANDEHDLQQEHEGQLNICTVLENVEIFHTSFLCIISTRKDLKNLRLVNKQFRTVFLTPIFNEIVVRLGQESISSKDILALRNIGSNVKTARFKFRNHSIDPSVKELISIVKALPNLEIPY